MRNMDKFITQYLRFIYDELFGEEDFDITHGGIYISECLVPVMYILQKLGINVGDYTFGFVNFKIEQYRLSEYMWCNFGATPQIDPKSGDQNVVLTKELTDLFTAVGFIKGHVKLNRRYSRYDWFMYVATVIWLCDFYFDIRNENTSQLQQVMRNYFPEMKDKDENLCAIEFAREVMLIERNRKDGL